MHDLTDRDVRVCNDPITGASTFLASSSDMHVWRDPPGLPA